MLQNSYPNPAHIVEQYSYYPSSQNNHNVVDHSENTYNNGSLYMALLYHDSVIDGFDSSSD